MIYFMQADTLVKIGTAVDVGKRKQLLQTGCPFRIVVLGVMPGGQWDEKHLHGRFAAYRVRGEWFNLSQEICDFIEGHCRPYLGDVRPTDPMPSEFMEAIRASLAA